MRHAFIDPEGRVHGPDGLAGFGGIDPEGFPLANFSCGSFQHENVLSVYG
jgi:hypothetical protein